MANVFGQMKDLYKLQREAKEMQKKLREDKYVGESSDGRVKVYLNGAQEFEDIEIAEDLLAPDMLELIKKGMKEAYKDYQKKLAKQMASTFDVDDVKKMLGQ